MSTRDMPSATPETAARPQFVDPYRYRRRKTRVVPVGKVGVGGDNPIRVQSMTTTDTLDVEATIAQTLRMVEAGCEIVRITAPTVNDARALGKIKEGLLKRGVDLPLVADIHFSPQAALESAEYVEKIRINPGNFVDTKRFAVKEYSDEQYAAELERIEAAFTPLVEKLKRLKRALRIGTNHGSLSDRILNRYGDTPLGMAESALEYVRVCEKNGYRDIILSMKSSNPKVMIQAYRLLAARMDELGMDYPFHLGVTEAGGGEDGRIKSAVGIGSLLEDGIGDTIRVSLTEDPELEVPVCYALARRFQPRKRPERASRAISVASAVPRNPKPSWDPFSYSRRKSRAVKVGPFWTGGPQLVRVVTRLSSDAAPDRVLNILEEQLKKAQGQDPEILEWIIRTPEDEKNLLSMRNALSSETSRLAFLARFTETAPSREALASADIAAWTPAGAPAWENFLKKVLERGIPVLIEAPETETAIRLEAAARAVGVPALISIGGSDSKTALDPGALLKEYRLLAARLAEAGSDAPVHIKAPPQAGPEDEILQSSVLIGSLLCDGIGDSIQIESTAAGYGSAEPKRNIELCYNILQAAGVRITKTEFVSCPSCGRTLFDLQTTTARIQSKTGHLKGVKIAIMGCIVNGPG
ncbi:MAG: (E)-4-hydroxy-3-methylbut-2-enyl-diphosphate synthase, partial [Elusimicrobia bacterium]|nr:(E)-4-hydroxy-3-methylbut-2-enyl-diphosphate synthase [Elusimicrobiota bacterium]